jgi:starch-binding outer membrane protein SusE/F
MNYRYFLIFLLSFSHLSLQSQTIGILGSATPSGWMEDIDLQQDATDPEKWSIQMPLEKGECKFRQDDAWDVNWGAADFPTGTATTNGANVIIDNAANYLIEFHTGTGAYSFVNVSDLGLIGTATPFGLAATTDLLQDLNNQNLYTRTLQLQEGTCRFQFNTNPVTSWGASDFPAGTATSGGSDIQIPKKGQYQVTFDKSSGVYLFEQKVDARSVRILGNADPMNGVTNGQLAYAGPNQWTTTTLLVDGELRFQINDDADLTFGATGFPSGTAVLGGSAIPVAAGEYRISFDATTYAYSFTSVDKYVSIGIIGSSTVDGWNQDIDLSQDANDPSRWFTEISLTDGEVKFRADNDWSANWGNVDFPIGQGIRSGQNIPVIAGNYLVQFHSVTGQYSFIPLAALEKVALLGDGTMMSNWNDELLMTQDPLRPYHYTLSGVDLKAGGVKFRTSQDWSYQWGAAQFPNGTGIPHGTTIPTQAGSYNIEFNSLTGEYTFSAVTSTLPLPSTDIAISLYPNPAQQWLEVKLNSEVLEMESTLALIDMQGKVVLQKSSTQASIIQLDVSQLAPGQYMVRLMNDKQISTKKVVKL